MPRSSSQVGHSGGGFGPSPGLGVCVRGAAASPRAASYAPRARLMARVRRPWPPRPAPHAGGRRGLAAPHQRAADPQQRASVGHLGVGCRLALVLDQAPPPLRQPQSTRRQRRRVQRPAATTPPAAPHGVVSLPRPGLSFTRSSPVMVMPPFATRSSRRSPEPAQPGRHHDLPNPRHGKQLSRVGRPVTLGLPSPYHLGGLLVRVRRMAEQWCERHLVRLRRGPRPLRRPPPQASPAMFSLFVPCGYTCFRKPVSVRARFRVS